VKATESGSVAIVGAQTFQPLLRAHVEIARPDHWIKNVFVLPGIVAALAIDGTGIRAIGAVRIPMGLFAYCLVASSNYVLNELRDAPFDLFHPVKSRRPVPSGRVSIPWAYAEWIVLMAAGLGLGLMISGPFAGTLAALWVMGCVYNLPPLRTKDVPYADVLSEAVNNPIRMLGGWYLTLTTAIPPLSLLLTYWMAGCYFMAIKRFAEFREINDPERCGAYRRSFRYYSEPRLLVSTMFYGAQAMLFFGAFLMRYRIELVLAFPVIALVMAQYFALAFDPNSAAQHPEKLHRDKKLMLSVISCSILLAILMFVNMPLLHRIFSPTISRYGR
jgi:4-hydroxybenzoate polyprenyltransferase